MNMDVGLPRTRGDRPCDRLVVLMLDGSAPHTWG